MPPNDPEFDNGWLVSGVSDPDSVRTYYDDFAAAYDATLDSWGYDAPQRVAGLVLANVGVGSDVLDAGCGTGLVGAALRDAGATGSITGIDLSTTSLSEADGRSVYSQLAVADLQQPLEFGNASFDAVVCVGVMTYVPDVHALWAEFCRVTRPGGVIVCTQRTDLWESRACATIVDEFETAGYWKVVTLTAGERYLPGHSDFADTIGVRYLACVRR